MSYTRTRKVLTKRVQIAGRSRENDWELILSAAADAAEQGMEISGDTNVSNVLALNPDALVSMTSGEPLSRNTIKDMMSVGRTRMRPTSKLPCSASTGGPSSRRP
jgi:hypothetical protein